MDMVFSMVFRDDLGKIIDIRESTGDHFFRKDGSFRTQYNNFIQENIKQQGSFSFGPKENISK